MYASIPSARLDVTGDDSLLGLLEILNWPEANHLQVYLAMEEKEENVISKAERLVSTFNHSFFEMSYTLHPPGLPNEVQGKSSNVSWAAKQACKDYSGGVNELRDIIITVMDGG